MNRLILWTAGMFFCSFSGLRAQDLDSLLNDITRSEKPEYVLSTFNTTRVILGQSVEMPVVGDLTFTITHRFGEVRGGLYSIFGLDYAHTRIGFEYGINDYVGLYIGRTNLEKNYDGGIKIRLLRQQTGIRNIPVSVTLNSNMTVSAFKWLDEDRDNLFSSRFYFVNQLLVARKFNKRLSLQLAPTHVHRNLVPREIDQNDVFAAGFGAKFQITWRVSFNGEYYYLLPGQTADDRYDAFSLGFDLETGGHVFQLHASNASWTNDRGMITATDGSWLDGDIFLGFNIYRVFPLSEKRKNIH